MLQRIVRLLAVSSVLTIACAQTDAGITTAVKSKFGADDTVKAYQINVDTADHVVTLRGSVDSAAAREQAVMIAKNTDGVRDVVDRLDVSAPAATTGVTTTDTFGDDLKNAADKSGNAIGNAADKTGNAISNAADKTGNAISGAASKTGEVMTDAAITTDVKTKFLADSRISGLKIDVDTKNGVVTLHGTVPSRAEVDRAMMVARDSAGVKSVVNSLRVEK